MTVRAKPTTKPRRRTHAQSEERQQFLVTLGFLAVIALAVLSLLAAIAVAYYNDHFQAVATVEGTQISKDQWRERVELLQFRADRAEARAREAASAGELSDEDLQSRLATINEMEQGAPNQAVDDLIDLSFQGRLAAQQNLSVTPDEVDAAQRKEASRPERRRVQVVVVHPGSPETGPVAEPTDAERAAARQQAEKALQDVQSGRPFAEVVRQYSTDPSKDNGGDIGLLTESGTADPALLAAVFKLPLNGTTEIVRGTDSAYRFARVTEILPAEDDPSYLTDLQKVVPLADFRRNVEAETLAQKLKDKVVADATAGPVEQLHLRDILILPAAAGADEGATEPQEEARYAHVLYSPKDDASGASALPATDPAWSEVEKQAQATAAALRAIPDQKARLRELGVVAARDSDDAGSKDQGGEGGYTTRAPLAKAFGDALFAPTNKEGDVIGPVRTEFGYHVIMFLGRRASFDAALKAVQDAVSAPGADFAAIAREHSEGPNAAEGGELGWFVRQQLPPEVAGVVLTRQAGQVSAPLGLTDGTHIYQVVERAVRPLDVDQRSILQVSAFDEWYQPLKTEAENAEPPRITRDEAAVAPPAPDPGAPGGVPDPGAGDPGVPGGDGVLPDDAGGIPGDDGGVPGGQPAGP